MLIFARRPRSVREYLGLASDGVRPRRTRAYRPDGATRGLERRAAPSAAFVGAIKGVPAVERANLAYPTPGGRSQKLNLYAPPGPPPAGGRPVIIAIHGGGWRKNNKTDYGNRMASIFVPRGYVVVSPNYVLSAPHRPSWPANLENVRSVVAWVRSNAGGLGIDPNRVAAMGESAGGNLAELLGTDPGPPGTAGASTNVNAVIAFSAPSNLPALYAASPWAGRAAAQFLGGTPRQVPARYAAASPIDHVAPGDPPMLLVHGLQDTLVPAGQSRTMAAALDAARVPNQLILVPGGHALDFPVHYANLTRRLLEFLSRTWEDEGTSTRS